MKIQNILGLLIFVINCVPCGAADDLIYLDQGLSPDLRQDYYNDPQGSKLIPYDWYLALEQPYNNKQFNDDEHIRAYGHLPNEQNKYNPDGLPVGFVMSVRQEKRWMGLTCAACHSAQIEYQGKSVRIDGGPGLPDIINFQSAISAALKQTVNRKAKWTRFSNRVLGNEPNSKQLRSLKNDVNDWIERMETWAARNRPAYPSGFGRMDAVHVAFNDVTAYALNAPENFRTPVAPVSYPSIWLSDQLDQVLWNGSVNSILTRGIGEAVIVFGEVKLKEDLQFESSVSIPEIDNMYDALANLKPPRWPEEILGVIDQEKAARGAKLYVSEGCVKCHANKPPYPMTEPNVYGKQFIKTINTPLEEIGTDPVYAVGFLSRTTTKSIAAPLFKETMFENEETIPAAILFLKGLAVFTEYELQRMKSTPEEILSYSGGREPLRVPNTPEALAATLKQLSGYRSLPLAGVWSTAPYLHNGSVSSLYELLLPPEKRAKTFFVGNREFDPGKVGYRSEEAEGLFEFDTSIPGNSNSGHEYGTKLSDEQRWDLVEYLKTL